jgi:aminoglycoside phosphotransferase (APT) family kinase protein
MICASQLIDSEKCSGAASPAEIARHLERSAPAYFGADFGRRPEARLVRERRRINSEILEFEVRGDQTPCRVMIKRSLVQARKREQAAAEGIEDRLRLFPKSDPATRHLSEYHALLAIRRRFVEGEECGQRFGAIRPLEALSHPYALVMEKSESAGLGSIWRRANRLQDPFLADDVAPLVRRAGEWLRIFHDMPPLEHTRPRGPHQGGEYLETVERFTSSLTAAGPEYRLFRDLPARLAPAARLLPSPVPLGLSHSDFAPRNILVGPDGRITVFDTQACWQAPRYEDLAWFLIAIKASGPQICTGGLLYDRRLLTRCEDALLAGYFGDEEVPRCAVRLFECLLVLERLAALVHRRRQARGWRRAAKGLRLALWRRYLVDQIRRYLADIETLTA